MENFIRVYSDALSKRGGGKEYIETLDIGDGHEILMYSTEDGDGDLQVSKREILDDIEADMAKLSPVKEKGMKYRVAFLMESFFIGNSSGVYTFIRHFATMCKEHDMHLDIILDQKSIREIPDDMAADHVSIFIHDNEFHNPEGYVMFTKEFEGGVRSEVFERTFKQYLEEFTPDLVVGHSMPSTKALHNMSDLFKEKGIKRLAYTHIGDVMDPNNIDMLDFRSEVILDYLDLFQEIDFPIGTQTKSSKEAIEKVAPKGECIVLPEPYYSPNGNYRPTKSTLGVLIIASHYSRKRFDLMFEILAITGLPVTVICGNDTLGGVTLRELAEKAGVQGYRQITNMPNKYLSGIIAQHRVMLHLSEAEVMPYAILEASEKIPCIINGNAPWAEGELPCPVIKVDPSDVYGCVSTIIETYGDAFEYKVFDSASYTTNCDAKWKEFIDG